MSPKQTQAALEAKVNSYNAVEITDVRSHGGYAGLAKDVAGQLAPVDPREFERDLWQSLQVWKREGRKGVWLRVGIGASELIPIAIQAGFKFHHAEPTYVMLAAWLPEDQENKLPPGPSHFIGVAGFVLNSKNEVLCIREKSGPSARLKDFWKLPGGLVDQQEDLRDAVVREVFEETGVRTKFKEIASIQEVHSTGARADPPGKDLQIYIAFVFSRLKTRTRHLSHKRRRSQRVNGSLLIASSVADTTHALKLSLGLCSALQQRLQKERRKAFRQTTFSLV